METRRQNPRRHSLTLPPDLGYAPRFLAVSWLKLGSVKVALSRPASNTNRQAQKGPCALDDAPGAALLGILLMLGAVTLGVRTARRKT
jgi:hypothetical protein